MACHLIPATEWSVHRWNFHVKADFLTDFMSSDLRRSTIFSLPSNLRHPARSDVLFRCFYIPFAVVVGPVPGRTDDG